MPGGDASRDSVADTSTQTYSRSWETSVTTVISAIEKMNNSLRVRFDITNHHNGLRSSQSLAKIHLPVIIETNCKYSLSGKYMASGGRITYQTVLYENNNDTLFKNMQLNSENTAPDFFLDTLTADSIGILEGNLKGQLYSNKTYILDVTFDIYGMSYPASRADGNGYIEIFIDFSNVSCKPEHKYIVKFNQFEDNLPYYYNLLGKKISISHFSRVPSGSYFKKKHSVLKTK